MDNLCSWFIIDRPELQIFFLLVLTARYRMRHRERQSKRFWHCHWYFRTEECHFIPYSGYSCTLCSMFGVVTQYIWLHIFRFVLFCLRMLLFIFNCWYFWWECQSIVVRPILVHHQCKYTHTQTHTRAYV